MNIVIMERKSGKERIWFDDFGINYDGQIEKNGEYLVDTETDEIICGYWDNVFWSLSDDYQLVVIPD